MSWCGTERGTLSSQGDAMQCLKTHSQCVLVQWHEWKQTKRYCSTAGLIIDKKFCISSTVFAALQILKTVTIVPYVWWEQPLCLYQPDMGGVWLLFPPKLVPHRWLNNKEEKKVLGEKREKNKRKGRHQPPQTSFFGEKKHPVNKTSAFFFFLMQNFFGQWAVFPSFRVEI